MQASSPFNTVMNVVKCQFIDEERFRMFEVVAADQLRDEPDFNEVIRWTDILMRNTVAREWIKPEFHQPAYVIEVEGRSQRMKRRAREFAMSFRDRLRSEWLWIKQKCVYVAHEAYCVFLYVRSQLFL